MHSHTNENQERRTEQRAALSGQIAFAVDGKENSITGALINISTRGMAFSANKKIQEGVCHFFTFLLPPHLQVTNAKAKIVRQEKCGTMYVIAVVFLSITEASRIAINTYMKN